MSCECWWCSTFWGTECVGQKKGGTMGKSSIAIDVVHKKQESLSASCCDRWNQRGTKVIVEKMSHHHHLYYFSNPHQIYLFEDYQNYAKKCLATFYFKAKVWRNADIMKVDGKMKKLLLSRKLKLDRLRCKKSSKLAVKHSLGASLCYWEPIRLSFSFVSFLFSCRPMKNVSVCVGSLKELTEK